jgi:hypothetical protein
MALGFLAAKVKKCFREYSSKRSFIGKAMFISAWNSNRRIP